MIIVSKKECNTKAMGRKISYIYIYIIYKQNRNNHGLGIENKTKNFCNNSDSKESQEIQITEF